MKTTICFDLDGTVLDSKPGVFHSVTIALDELSFPRPSDKELMAFLGPPLQDGFANVCHVPPDRVADAIRSYRAYYSTEGMFEASIFEGIPELLQQLRKVGKQTVVTTSKPQVFARRILERFGVAPLFDGIYGSELDNTRSRKSEVLRYAMQQMSFSVEDAVLIGDRVFDVQGAKEVGMDIVGILYGYGTREELQVAGADCIVEDMPALYDLLKTL
ncbi:MAG: HAD hydrolase-like protein [Clostridia bacterium]|nr:HAD hydrolase-like protein [Clostridia bacterium]